MLKYFEGENSCHILIKPSITLDDIKTLKILLEGRYDSWKVEFGRVYSLPTEIITLLYKSIFEDSKKITIVTHKNKLNRYLHKLGFSTNFESWIKNDVVDLNNIELILIGGSASSSEKIIEIVKNTELNNLNLVVVQHVESGREGIFDAILQRYTKYKVSYAQAGDRVQKGQIYLAPNDKHLRVKDGMFYLDDGAKYNFSKPSVSISYESFSNYYKEKLLVIQECGYANDGVDKLELLKQNSSKLILQDIDECEAKPMVKNAMNIGVQNYILNQENIIDYINILGKDLSKHDWIEYLLEMIYKKYDYDFRLYHREMVVRRVDIFMIKHDIQTIKDAVGVILFNKSAFKGFFLELSINVTELFRNPDSFQEISKFLDKKYKNRRNIKLWSAGCSSGEEVYSLAILLQKKGLLQRSLLYATDFNSVIIDEAKNGLFTKESYQLAKENFSKMETDTDLESYFKINKNYVEIDEHIKSKTLFFQHNLILDSSFNEFDIIICKNVIIYFDADLQKKVFQLFYDSLKFGGYLVLGESESISPPFVDKFDRCQKCKIFKKVA